MFTYGVSLVAQVLIIAFGSVAFTLFSPHFTSADGKTGLGMLVFALWLVVSFVLWWFCWPRILKQEFRDRFRDGVAKHWDAAKQELRLCYDQRDSCRAGIDSATTGLKGSNQASPEWNHYLELLGALVKRLKELNAEIAKLEAKLYCDLGWALVNGHSREVLPLLKQ